MARTIPNILDARNQYSVNRADAKEGVRQSLYDFQIYPTAGATQFTFFQLPQGQGQSSQTGTVAGAVKTIGDTNMEAAGQLPNPKNFLIESIEIHFEPGSVSTANTYTSISPVLWSAGVYTAITGASWVSDSDIVRKSGELRLFIGSKSYLDEAPLGRFPPKARPGFNGAAYGVTAASNWIAGVYHWDGRPYYVEPAIFLESTQNFSVTLNFPVAVATPSGFNARIGVILDGYLYRNAQ